MLCSKSTFIHLSNIILWASFFQQTYLDHWYTLWPFLLLQIESPMFIIFFWNISSTLFKNISIKDTFDYAFFVLLISIFFFNGHGLIYQLTFMNFSYRLRGVVSFTFFQFIPYLLPPHFTSWLSLKSASPSFHIHLKFNPKMLLQFPHNLGQGYANRSLHFCFPMLVITLFLSFYILFPHCANTSNVVKSCI